MLKFPAWQKLLYALEDGFSVTNLSKKANVAYPFTHRLLSDVLEPEGFVKFETVGREKKIFLTTLGREWSDFLSKKDFSSCMLGDWGNDRK